MWLMSGKMAETKSGFPEGALTCPICLDLLKIPVAVPCGHSFCKDCISCFWDQNNPKTVCPQCGENFTTRPELKQNIVLTGLVEHFKNTTTEFYAGPGDVECDVCSGVKQKAVKSCLVCLVSFCKTHLQPHESPAFRKHKLVAPCAQFETQFCPVHDKTLDVFCRTDNQLICMLCVMDNHTRHVTVSASSERAEKQRKLGEALRKCHESIQEKEKNVKDLRETVATLKRSSRTAIESAEKMFAEMNRYIQEKTNEVKKQIKAQEKAEVIQAEARITQLETQITELKRRDTEMQQLSSSADHIQFIQSFQALSTSSECEDAKQTTTNTQVSFEEVSKTLNDLKKKLVNFSEEALHKIDKQVSRVLMTNTLENKEASPYVMHVGSTPDPVWREEFLKYQRKMAVDYTTQHKNFHYGCWNPNCNTHTDKEQFDVYLQALAGKISQRCYWEVEWSGRLGVHIAVSYKTIGRKGAGKEFGFGRNEKSWSLYCSPKEFSYWHNDSMTAIPVSEYYSRIGVYVDCEKGILAFYGITGRHTRLVMDLIHQVQTNFSEPLYAGFGVNPFSSFTFC